MKQYFKDDKAETKIAEMEKVIKIEEIEDNYVQELIGNQKGELRVDSKYYKGNIAEGNWCLIDEFDIETLDSCDELELLMGNVDGYSERKKDAEYEYIFIPSYYAVKILLLYYMGNPKKAERIYNIKNAILGGLCFIQKYLGGDYKDKRVDFEKLIQKIFYFKDKAEYDNNFINKVIDCINNFNSKNLLLENEIEKFNESRNN